MKSNTFNYSLLAVGIAAVMGISTGANAAVNSGDTSSGAAPINNVATASYSVGTIAQPNVTSNTVTVNVSETANFSLVAINGTSATDDKNESITTTPGNGATFNHILTNNGNVTDTYTINTTGVNDSTITTATPNYELATAGTNGITYTILKADGTAAVAADLPTGQSPTGTLSNNQALKLPPKFKATLSYTVTTPTTRTGGDIAVGTLTATSTFINAATSSTKVPTLANENQNIVRLPTFSIVKTAASSLDLTAVTPQIDYTITVTNANTTYSAVADSFVIRDVLPAGVTLTGDVTASNATVTSSRTDANSRQIIDIAVPSLAAGANQVITFKVNVDKTKYTAANSSITNNVAVYDKFTGTVGVLPVIPVVDTNYDILDSTDNTIDYTRLPPAADQSGGNGVDNPVTTTFTRRSLTLVAATTREIAPTTSTTNTDGQVTHVATITNNGQDDEGNTTNPLTLTFTDGTNAAVDPVLSQFFLVYTPSGGTAIAPIAVTPTKSGNVYTISSNQFPVGVALAPGDALEVRYNMASSSAVVSSTENTVVKLTATGTGAPTVTPITDITIVKGLTLEKFQALDINCDGNISGTGEIAFTKDLITGAKPDQCIIYRIDAKNTSSAIQTTKPALASGFNITALEIKDLFSNFSAGADFVTSSASSSATNNSTIADPVVVTDTSVATTASTLAPQGSATLKFSVKVKNNR